MNVYMHPQFVTILQKMYIHFPLTLSEIFFVFPRVLSHMKCFFEITLRPTLARKDIFFWRKAVDFFWNSTRKMQAKPHHKNGPFSFLIFWSFFWVCNRLILWIFPHLRFSIHCGYYLPFLRSCCEYEPFFSKRQEKIGIIWCTGHQFTPCVFYKKNSAWKLFRFFSEKSHCGNNFCLSWGLLFMVDCFFRLEKTANCFTAKKCPHI